MRKLSALVLATMLTALLAVPALGSGKAKNVTVGARSNEFSFSPKKLKIKRGTKVVWTWGPSGLMHNVTVTKGPVKFHSKNLRHGKFSHLFSKPGTYTLICTFHVSLGMRMTITVT